MMNERTKEIMDDWYGMCSDKGRMLTAQDAIDRLVELDKENVRLRDQLGEMEANVVRDETGAPIDFLQAATVLEVQRQRWQEMAEDLWEELQEWHGKDCPRLRWVTATCTCHRILAAKWDELANWTPT